MSVLAVPLQFADERAHLRLIANSVNQMSRGRSNNTGRVTLQANSGSTTITDARIAFDSAILLMPTTTTAAAALATTYVAATGRKNGEATIAHANNAQTDRTFVYVIQG